MLQERARIARELHDSVSQTLYAIALTASRAVGQPEQMHRAMSEVLRLTDAGQSELRSLLANLRSDLLTSGGLTDGLARLAADVRARNDLEVDVSAGEEPDLPPATRDALVLISREALHNVVRHSGADRVDVVLETDAQSVVLVISDNGRGFDPGRQRPGHFGLQSMRERAAAVGGVLSLTSVETVGTQLRVRVPRISG
jgi:signal transduction histidine kinase